MSTVNFGSLPTLPTPGSLKSRNIESPRFGETIGEKVDQFADSSKATINKVVKTSVMERVKSFFSDLGRGLKAAWLPAAVSLGLIGAAVTHVFTGGLSTLLLGAGIGGSGSLALLTGIQEALKGKRKPLNLPKPNPAES